MYFFFSGVGTIHPPCGEANSRATSCSSDHAGFHILCKKCENEILLSSQVEKIEDQYVVKIELIGDKFSVRKIPDTGRGEWKKEESVKCKECKNPWGVKVTYRSIHGVLILHIRSFCFRDQGSDTIHRFGSWSEFPLTIPDFKG